MRQDSTHLMLLSPFATQPVRLGQEANYPRPEIRHFEEAVTIAHACETQIQPPAPAPMHLQKTKEKTTEQTIQKIDCGQSYPRLWHRSAGLPPFSPPSAPTLVGAAPPAVSYKCPMSHRRFNPPLFKGGIPEKENQESEKKNPKNDTRGHLCALPCFPVGQGRTPTHTPSPPLTVCDPSVPVSVSRPRGPPRRGESAGVWTQSVPGGR